MCIEEHLPSLSPQPAGDGNGDEMGWPKKPCPVLLDPNVHMQGL